MAPSGQHSGLVMFGMRAGPTPVLTQKSCSFEAVFRLLVRFGSSIAFSVGLFDQSPQICVFTAGRFQIENEVFDAQSEVVQRFLKFTDRALESVLMKSIGRDGLSLGIGLARKLLDAIDEFGHLALERVFVHVVFPVFFLVVLVDAHASIETKRAWIQPRQSEGM